MALTIGWAHEMYVAMGTRGLHMTKRPYSKESLSIFFIVYILVCSFFILNLFVGVIITTYNREKEKLGKNFLLTEQQKKWLETKILIIEAKPKVFMRKPKTKWRQSIYNLVSHRYFDRAIMSCIIFNALILCNKWYN